MAMEQPLKPMQVNVLAFIRAMRAAGSEPTTHTVAEAMGLPIKTVSGVLGHLVQRGVVWRPEKRAPWTITADLPAAPPVSATKPKAEAGRYVPKQRKCLRCRKSFKSTWAGNWICPCCKNRRDASGMDA